MWCHNVSLQVSKSSLTEFIIIIIIILPALATIKKLIKDQMKDVIWATFHNDEVNAKYYNTFLFTSYFLGVYNPLLC